MATLTGTKIKDTYKSLVKVTDNAEAGTTGKQLSDGNGNNLGLYVDTDGVFGIGAAANLSLDISSKTDAVGLPVGTDGNRPTGGAGQIRYNTTDGKLEFYDSAWRHVASENYVNTEIANLIDSAPQTLDTLNELAAALNDDANFHTTITNLIGDKQDTITGAATTVTTSNLTTDRAVISNGSGKIAVSDVTSTELGYLDGVTSNVQTQLNGMQDAISGGATTITDTDLTANRALISNSSGKVSVSAVTNTELAHLDGVTSAVQTQIDGKQDIVTIAVTVSGGKFYIDGTQQQTVTLGAGITYRFDQSDSSNATHPLQFSTTSDGTHNSGSAYTTGVTVSGTAGSADAYVQIITEQDTPKLYYYCSNHSGMGGALSHLSDKQDTITGGATTITSSDLTADRALLSNGSGKVAVSDVTATELGYLDGVTSNIQTQINNIGGSQDVFKTIAVSGQSDVVADSTTDSLTLAGASGITITTDASTDTITFTGSGGGGGGSGLSWQSTAKTANFNAATNEGYFVNTTSGAVTVTMPTASVGDVVGLIDLNGTSATNNILIGDTTAKVFGKENAAEKSKISSNFAGVRLVYSGSTQGWMYASDFKVDDVASQPLDSYATSFLIVAGGGASGGGGGNNYCGGGGGGAGGLRSNYSTDTSGGGNAASNEVTFNATPNVSYTITIGAGGTGTTGTSSTGDGNDSSIAGSGLTTITAVGGGNGGGEGADGRDGGSGGGGGNSGSPSYDNNGSGTANQGTDGGDGQTGASGAGGGGASTAGGNTSGSGSSSAGGNGGSGVATTIISHTKATDRSVGEVSSNVPYFGGGGGGGGYVNGGGGSAGLGGGGVGSTSNSNTAGDPNTGGGGGGQDFYSSQYVSRVGKNGGSGVVILRVPTSRYSGDSSQTNLDHSYTDGSDTVLIFKQSGTFVG